MKAKGRMGAHDENMWATLRKSSVSLPHVAFSLHSGHLTRKYRVPDPVDLGTQTC